jgi:hypothetical protein
MVIVKAISWGGRASAAQQGDEQGWQIRGQALHVARYYTRCWAKPDLEE